MPNKTAILVGILGGVVLGLAAISLIQYSSIPAITVTTSLGNLPISQFYQLDLYSSVALIIAGASLLLVSISGNFR